LSDAEDGADPPLAVGQGRRRAAVGLHGQLRARSMAMLELQARRSVARVAAERAPLHRRAVDASEHDSVRRECRVWRNQLALVGLTSLVEEIQTRQAAALIHQQLDLRPACAIDDPESSSNQIAVVVLLPLPISMIAPSEARSTHASRLQNRCPFSSRASRSSIVMAFPSGAMIADRTRAALQCDRRWRC